MPGKCSDSLPAGETRGKPAAQGYLPSLRTRVSLSHPRDQQSRPQARSRQLFKKRRLYMIVNTHFELTKYQVNQLRTLGRTLWPAINLPCDELCRRVLLDGADRRMVRSDGERSLEVLCQPEA